MIQITTSCSDLSQAAGSTLTADGFHGDHAGDENNAIILL